MKVSDLHRLYEAEVRDVSVESYRRVKYNLNRWVRLIGDTDVVKITTEMFKAFRQRCLDLELSPRTIESTIGDMSFCLRLTGRPVQYGRRLRSRPPNPLVPTVQEIGKLYRAAGKAKWPRLGGGGYRDDCIPEWCQCSREEFWRSIIVAACWTGMRRRDLIQLTWAHIDAEAYTASKTRKKHPIVLTGFLRRHLELLRGCDCDLIWPKSPAKQMRHALRDICSAAGTRHITMHGFRRFAYTQWAAANHKAGEIIHGCGLPAGVTRHYVDSATVLKAAAPLVKIPDCWLTTAEREERTRGEAELIALFRAADPQTRDLILDVTRKLG